MKCSDCGFNNPQAATVCKGCNGPLNRALVARHTRPNSDDELRALSLWTAGYEARRYGLMPKQYDETEETFVTRINNAKTPYVLVEHARIVEGHKPKAIRIPGSDDDQEAAHGS